MINLSLAPRMALLAVSHCDSERCRGNFKNSGLSKSDIFYSAADPAPSPLSRLINSEGRKPVRCLNQRQKLGRWSYPNSEAISLSGLRASRPLTAFTSFKSVSHSRGEQFQS